MARGIRHEGKVVFQDKQAKIASLWYQGNSKLEIIKKTGYPDGEVEGHLRLIRRSLTPKTEAILQYRKNKVLSKVNLVQRKAWEIAEEAKVTAMTSLAALRVVTSSQELEAKVEGVTQEKLVVGPEKEASRLLGDILKIEKEAAQEQKEKVKEKVSPDCIGVELPDFLKNMEK